MRVFSLSLLCLLTLSFCVSAQAQEQIKPEDSKKVDSAPPILAGPGLERNQELLSEYAEEMKRLRADLGLPDPAMVADAKTPEPAIDPSKINLRVISGKEGIPFPRPEQVVMQPTPTPQNYPAFTPIPTPTPYQRAANCERSNITKNVALPNVKDNQILLDKLFLPQDLVPLDPEEIYGPQVELYPYGPNVGEGQYILQEMYSVPCLPYRIRSTAWGEYQITGVDALKYYDRKSSVPLRLDKWVSKKIYGTKSKR